VLGGGNIIRGVSAAAQGIDRVAGDHMGLLATVINGLALQDALEKRSVTTRLMSAVEIGRSPSRSSADARSDTSTRAASCSSSRGRAIPSSRPTRRRRCGANEIHADVLLKATKVDGVYDANPDRDPTAKFLKTSPIARRSTRACR
jgi:uridylate kinase